MFLIVFCHSANFAVVLIVKGKYMKPSVVIRYYRHAHAVSSGFSQFLINPLKAELNPICHLLALLGVHHFLHVSRIRVKATQICPLMVSVLIRLYGFKQATIRNLVIMYSETNTNKASEIKYNRYVHAVVMTLEKG
jgi:hypothetical protein